MALVEVMVAAAVFTLASCGSLQLFAQAADNSQQTELSQQRLERIELDRLQLQAHWRRELSGVAPCSVTPEQLKELASAVPTPPQVYREVVAGEQTDEIRLLWKSDGESTVVRERLVTTAGLGASCSTSAPLTDSQGEGVQ